jgi:hypothetical protein
MARWKFSSWLRSVDWCHYNCAKDSKSLSQHQPLYGTSRSVCFWPADQCVHCLSMAIPTLEWGCYILRHMIKCSVWYNACISKSLQRRRSTFNRRGMVTILGCNFPKTGKINPQQKILLFRHRFHINSLVLYWFAVVLIQPFLMMSRWIFTIAWFRVE